ncbi:MAG: ABC transporter ATP-binding protein [Sphaerochaeta sp.]|jgi:ATP-binding cassette subfamily B protein|nr:ABC transporter ATP-binding protein [Spirochaetales bacterium]HKM08624.1 ABC transporter ATP-binding protein [Sphaerochaeta sp.]
MKANRQETKKLKIDKNTMRRLLDYIFIPYKKRFILVLISIVVSALAGVGGSLFLRILIDDFIIPLSRETNPSFLPLLKALGIMASIYALGVVATFLYNRLMITIAQSALRNIRDDMFAHMQHLSIRFFDTNAHGDLMSLYTNDTDTLRQMVTQSIPNIFASSLTVIAIFFAMLFTSWALTVVVIFSLVGMLWISSKIARRSGKYFMDQQKSLAKTNGFIEEMIHGQKVVKVFTYEKEAEKSFDKLNEELFNNANRANRFANILMPIMGNISYIQYVFVAIAGGMLAISGWGGILTLGAIATFLQLSRTINRPINQMAQQLNAVVMAMAGAKRIFALLDQKPEVDDGHVTLVNATYDENGALKETEERTNLWAWKDSQKTGDEVYTKLDGYVQFFNVDFGYNEDELVLKDVSLYARPTHKIALVGATGAGKTTITNLINRFYDLDDGKIRYDGININKIKKDALRRSLGVVLQDVNLFTGTVMDNIRYGRLDATDQEVIEAAKLANADSFIRLLPQGYESELAGDGSSLSQGQRQLISIARAIVANPPVLILDEATSSIDTRTEAIVQKGMDALMEGRTVFVIAHRLSTIKNADVIMVLEQGQIIERGTHEQLMDKKGQYQKLYTGVFELD